MTAVGYLSGAFVLKAGDTMTGDLVLPGDPDQPLEAATKQYVDNSGGGGGTPSNTVVTEQAYGQSSTAGVASTFSRGDHTHGTPALPTIPTPAGTVVSETTFGQAPAVGASTNFARQDHTHGTPAAPAVPAAGNTIVTETSFGQASTAGVSADFSRVDHTHGTPAAPAVPAVSNSVTGSVGFGQSPAVGFSLEYSRGDHVHGTPPAPTAASVGADPVGTAAGLAWLHTESPLLTGGNIVVPNSGSPTQIHTDLTLPAVAGETIAVGITCLVNPAGGELYWNAATIVSGVPVTYFGNATGTWPFPLGGISGWFCNVDDFTSPRGERKLKLGAQDISPGNVVIVRIYAQADNNPRTVRGDAGQPLQSYIVNQRLQS